MGCCPQHFRQLLLSLHPDWLRGILSCGLSTSGCLCSISMDKDSDDSPEARRDVLEFLGPLTTPLKRDVLEFDVSVLLYVNLLLPLPGVVRGLLSLMRHASSGVLQLH